MLKQRAMQNSSGGTQLPHGNGEARGEGREKEKQQQSGSELLK